MKKQAGKINKIEGDILKTGGSDTAEVAIKNSFAPQGKKWIFLELKFAVSKMLQCRSPGQISRDSQAYYFYCRREINMHHFVLY